MATSATLFELIVLGCCLSSPGGTIPETLCVASLYWCDADDVSGMLAGGVISVCRSDDHACALPSALRECSAAVLEQGPSSSSSSDDFVLTARASNNGDDNDDNGASELARQLARHHAHAAAPRPGRVALALGFASALVAAVVLVLYECPYLAVVGGIDGGSAAALGWRAAAKLSAFVLGIVVAADAGGTAARRVGCDGGDAAALAEEEGGEAMRAAAVCAAVSLECHLEVCCCVRAPTIDDHPTIGEGLERQPPNLFNNTTRARLSPRHRSVSLASPLFSPVGTSSSRSRTRRVARS
jgi:hypothetical protein